ncbi:hypothetical protein CRYUN_Cryun01aG0168900 [Craigia yunnanensis]
MLRIHVLLRVKTKAGIFCILGMTDKFKDAYALVDELENLIRPYQLELSEQEKIENIKRVEQISEEVHLLKKKLAWSWVYDVNGQLQKQRENIEKLKDRIPTCQAKIDSTLATKEKLELEEEHGCNSKQSYKMLNDVRMPEEQAMILRRNILEIPRFLLSDNMFLNFDMYFMIILKNLWWFLFMAEESEIEQQIKELEYAVDHVKSVLSRSVLTLKILLPFTLKDDENTLSEHVSSERDAMKKINDEIIYFEKKQREIDHQIRELRLHQTNRVTAFGGDGVLRLLHAIERHHHKFTTPPIGPIGAHVTLVNGDTWAPAVEQAIGKLLNAFIVTNSKDASALRECAKEARYNYFPIVIHKFSRPR